MKKINILLLSTFIIFLLGSANFIFAATTVEVAGGPCANTTNIGTCAVSVFKWGIDIAATLAALSFAVGAVMLIVSGDNNTLASSAKDRMKGSVYGLLLLGASYLIMMTINPAIVNPTVTALTPANIPAPPTPPGVYFYTDSGCTQAASQTIVSEDSIGPDIKYYSIVDDSTVKYGVILHKTNGFSDGHSEGGTCSNPPITDATTCQPVNGMNGAIDVFQISKMPSASGNGVTFYSEPFGEDKGARAGFFPVESAAITAPTTKEDPGMSFKYTGVDVSDPYQKTLCPTFQKCPGSIEIKGSYLVAVYSTGDYCQTFTKTVTDLNGQPVLAAGLNTMTDIFIIPTGGATSNTSASN